MEMLKAAAANATATAKTSPTLFPALNTNGIKRLPISGITHENQGASGSIPLQNTVSRNNFNLT
jgi:hypothetical protein